MPANMSTFRGVCPHCKKDIDDLIPNGEGGYHCPHCDFLIEWDCYACDGEGYVYGDEYYDNPLDYEHTLIVCPGCNGAGYTDAYMSN